MRPLRLLLSLCSSLIAITLILYLVFGSQTQAGTRAAPASAKKGKLTALFSFTSPASLFPPSAIISLTDDNSTFFLARPAAFGPPLPPSGLSGPLWVGSGFGDDAMGKGELGCSDVPGWNGESESPPAGTKLGHDSKSKVSDASGKQLQPRRSRSAHVPRAAENDGTDDHLHQNSGMASEHADIQSLQEGAEIAGKVVLLKRGGCGFLEKVMWAQRRGGVALIVGDDVRGGGLIRMYARGDTSNVSIPALFTSHTTAHLLSSLLPTGGLDKDLSLEDAAKLNLIKSGKGGKGKNQDKPGRKQASSRLAANKSASKPKQNSRQRNEDLADLESGDPLRDTEDTGLFRSLMHALGFSGARSSASGTDSRRPPSSGNLDWVLVEDWDDGRKSASRKSLQSLPTSVAQDSFIIGEHDWRDPDLLPEPTLTNSHPSPKASPMPDSKVKGGSVLPGSGEYANDNVDTTGQSKGWLSKLLGEHEDGALDEDSDQLDISATASITNASANAQDNEQPLEPDQHEGLWVTLTPTNMSTNPFFDTLLVLVVSPLVTLTVVYALLLLRSRIRRRRWRAPKSVVERLPIRTYHTISDVTPSATPDNSSPTTPLLQHTSSQPASSPSSSSRPRSRTASEVPATSSSFQQSGRTPEEEKREAGLAEWRRRYGGRQKECVVCLEEYVDGISRVMSLPCGHEFHADCITPWLVTRRRTCPICKGDVVRSLSQSYLDRNLRSLSPEHSPRFYDGLDSVQIQAAETRNDSPSASPPVPIASSSTAGLTNDFDADIEANWDVPDDADEERGIRIPQGRTGDLSGSTRDLSSTVVTTIWRGFDAVRSATGLQRQPSREEVDRDR